MNDFEIWYRAAHALLDGISPYSVHGFVSPLWALVPFIPLTFLSEPLAASVYQVVSFFGMLIAIARLKIPPKFIPVIVLLTPLVWFNLAFANLEWVVILGATLPPWLGIWLVALKPQMSVGLMVMWLLQRRKLQDVACLFGPLMLMLAVNYVVAGFPRPLSLSDWSYDLFPWGIAFGVAILVMAMAEKDDGAALASGLAFAPYVGITSWVGAVGLARTKRGLMIIFILSWAIFLTFKIRQGIGR